MSFPVDALLTGAGATVLMDLWGIARTRLLRVPAMSYGLVGIVSVAAPFLLMQPGMGAGIAASRTPHPTAARFNSLLTHTIVGLGLYVAARVTAPLLCSA